MQVPYGEDLASHTGPESWVAGLKASGEGLTIMSIAAFNEVDGYKPFAGGIGSRIWRMDARQDSGSIQRVRVFGEDQIPWNAD